MRGSVKIGSVEVEMLANAASPIFYKRLFHEDFLVQLQDLQQTLVDDNGTMTIHGDTSIFGQMGFIMAKQAEMSDAQLLNLKLEDYIVWLSQFDPMALINAVGDITQLYTSQEKASVQAKKKDE